MSDDRARRAGSYDLRFGQYLSRGVQAYLEQPSALLTQSLIAAGITLVAAMFCLFPAWLVAGPLSAGLHYSGLMAVRGKPVTTAAMKRGWKVAGSSMIAYLAMMFMQFVPIAIMYLLFVAGFVAISAAGGGMPFGIAGATGEDAIMMVIAIFALYGAMFFAMLVVMIWITWFGARTLYVMPLIADRGCSFVEALEESWRLTKSREWELTLLYFLTSMIAFIGMYLCYVGIILTLPVYFTIVAAAYEDHALPQFTPPADLSQEAT